MKASPSVLHCYKQEDISFNLFKKERKLEISCYRITGVKWIRDENGKE